MIWCVLTIHSPIVTMFIPLRIPVALKIISHVLYLKYLLSTFNLYSLGALHIWYGWNYTRGGPFSLAFFPLPWRSQVHPCCNMYQYLIVLVTEYSIIWFHFLLFIHQVMGIVCFSIVGWYIWYYEYLSTIFYVNRFLLDNWIVKP